jgi:hypothetical protein
MPLNVVSVDAARVVLDPHDDARAALAGTWNQGAVTTLESRGSTGVHIYEAGGGGGGGG